MGAAFDARDVGGHLDVSHLYRASTLCAMVALVPQRIGAVAVLFASLFLESFYLQIILTAAGVDEIQGFPSSGATSVSFFSVLFFSARLPFSLWPERWLFFRGWICLLGDREFQVVWCRSQLFRMYLCIFFCF